jgi:hypothetical protein
VVAAAGAVDRFPQVRRGVRRLALVRLLRAVDGASQVAVEKAAGELVADQRADRRRAHPVLTALRVVTGVDDGAGGDLRLVDRWHRLRAVR